MIYFVQLESGSIKIGFTDSVAQRIDALSSHYGSPVSLLGTMPGDMNFEKTLHQKFSHLRLGRTEQFRPARELLDFIGRPLLTHADPNSIEENPLNPTHRTEVIVVRCTPVYKDWFLRLCSKTRRMPARLIDHGLVKAAEEIGFDPPPKR